MKGRSKPVAKLKQRARSAGVSHVCNNMPIVVKSEPLYSKKYLGDKPYAVMINVACGFAIKEHIKEAVNPKFYWSGKFWVAVVRTKKLYDKAFSVIVEAAKISNLQVDDERGVWIPTTSYVNIDVFEDKDGPYARLHGATFEFKDIIKEQDGKYCGNTRDWEVAFSAFEPILKEILDAGVPVYGSFNHDGSFADLLSKSKYKLATAPQGVEVDDDADYWSYE
jgi:hypothetical protein